MANVFAIIFFDQEKLHRNTFELMITLMIRFVISLIFSKSHCKNNKKIISL